MAETIKKGDFVELEYTGVLDELDAVFDSTDEAVAKKEGIYDPKMAYGPVEICVGEGQILQGLDESMIGKEIGKELEIKLPPEKAFGRKDGKLLKLVPTSAFKKQNINPVPNLQVNIDGAVGTIRNVSGGRTVVDFNHPFSGKDVTYKVKVNRLITDEKEKVKALLSLALNHKKDAITVDIKGEKVEVGIKNEFPDEFLDLLKERVVKILPQFKEVTFVKPSSKKDGGSGSPEVAKKEDVDTKKPDDQNPQEGA